MSNFEQIKEISSRMKELREIFGVTKEELASKLHIDLDTYIQYEAAECDIPIGFLYDFSHYFNVSLTAILTGEEPKLNVYEVVKKGKGLKIQRRKQYDYRSLAYNFTNKKMEPFLVTVPPTSEEDTIVFGEHDGQEFNYVVEGTLKIVIDNHELILNEGDSIYFNSSYKHGMKALNGKEAKFLAIIV